LTLGISNPADRASVEIEAGGSLLQPLTVIYQEIGFGSTVQVMHGNRELARGYNPMGDARRRLVSEGHSPEQTIQAYWKGSSTPIWAAGTKLKQLSDQPVKKKTKVQQSCNLDQVRDRGKVDGPSRITLHGGVE
jgi:hypothetical protein